MQPHSFAWLNTVETSFPDELWYSNLGVTRGTFTYILREIGDEIARQDSPMQKANNAKSTTTNILVLPSVDCRISIDWKLVWCISFLCVYVHQGSV